VNLGELWTSLLDLVSQVVVPVWADLIQYIPLLLGLLLILSIAGLAWAWQRNAAGNRSRVPRPLPAGRKPEEMHLPGPSLWPFVAPVGLLVIVFAVVFGLDQVANMVLLSIGVVIAGVGLLGWYLDANREYVQTEAAAHGQLEAGYGAAPPAWTLQPPAGVHLPGPSAWPFLAPLGLGFMVAGLIFGPAMLIGGLIMAAIAAVGWLLDADRELAEVQAHGHATQGDRDPERAWPRRLMPVYVTVGGLAILLTLAPWLLSLLPGSA
jgi:hypothetical protein